MPASVSNPAFPALAGTVALPGMNFIGDTGSGLRAPGGGVVQLVGGGAVRLSIDAIGDGHMNGRDFTARVFRLALGSIINDSGGLLDLLAVGGFPVRVLGALAAGAAGDDVTAFSVNDRTAGGLFVASNKGTIQFRVRSALAADDDVGLDIFRRQAGVNTLQLVTQGIANSGGQGFKLLRVPN